MSRRLVSDAAEKHNRHNKHLAVLLVCWLAMTSSYLFSHDAKAGSDSVPAAAVIPVFPRGTQQNLNVFLFHLTSHMTDRGTQHSWVPHLSAIISSRLELI